MKDLFALKREKNAVLDYFNIDRNVIHFVPKSGTYRGYAYLDSVYFKDSIDDIIEALDKDIKVSLLIGWKLEKNKRKPYLIRINFENKSSMNPSMRI